jgi:hypothetical protein
MTSDWKQAAEEMDALKDSGHEMDGLVEVKAVVAAEPGEVVLLRLKSRELTLLESAAQQAGENVADFIRTAAIERATGQEGRLSSHASQDSKPTRRKRAS